MNWGILPYADIPASEEGTVFHCNPDTVTTNVDANWMLMVDIEENGIQIDASWKELDRYSIALCFLHTGDVLYPTISHQLRKTQDWNENPDILSFKLCRESYNDFIMKICQLSNPEKIMCAHDLNNTETNLEHVYDHVTMMFSHLYCQNIEDFGSYNVNFSGVETMNVSRLVFKYCSYSLFLRLFLNKRLLPYIRYLIQDPNNDNAIATVRSLMRIIKTTHDVYDELCKYEKHHNHFPLERDTITYPFRDFRLHYTTEFYYKKLFGTTLCIPSIIPQILRNPKVQQFREQSNFKMMIYGHPLASHGMCKEIMEELVEMGAIAD